MATPSHSPTQSPPLSTEPSAPRLPIEICERIIDFVAGPVWHRNRPPLTRCALVCRAWLLRCRFQLSPDKVTLRSPSDLASLTRFLDIFPPATAGLSFLDIHGRKDGDTSTADSWVSSVPAILGPLPHLVQLSIYDVDLAHQHPDIYELYSSFNIANADLILVRVSFHHFSHVARLVLATGTAYLVMIDCPSSFPSTDLGTLLPHNVFLKKIYIESATWKNLQSAILFGSDWFLSCPNLEGLSFLEDVTSQTPSPFSPQHAHVWSCVCDLFRRLHSRSVQPEKGIELKILSHPWILLRGGIPGASEELIVSRHLTYARSGENPKLTLERLSGSRASFVSGILQALPLLSSVGFSTVKIQHDMAWSWEDFTPEIWNTVDDALSQYCPFLTHFIFELLDYIEYHDVFTHQYGCIENLKRALFPRTAQRATIERVCVDDDCFIHEVARRWAHSLYILFIVLMLYVVCKRIQEGA
ncbi:hypothetical protein EUX98_g6052 [Antrodiella citrinella]|uniref:F-box domain-containing protein n=1 Tax=Antrodiella citrinella TaxID=2447956 RepID=A0A4S4MRU4_9APHY|nr:hypothetical protein EUX98_g6052 [Antrodiella citrinella]